MNDDDVWRHTHQQRRELAALLEDLGEEEWRSPSLCDAWTVREVAAHVIRSPTATLGDVVTAAVRARGSWPALVRDDARRAARRPVAEIIGDFGRYDGSRHRPPGTSHVDPLLDVLVHTQDIVLPLGRSHPMPVDAAVTAARRAYRTRFLFPGFRRLHGVELRATDSDLALGAGLLVEGRTEAILLLVTGRRAAALPRLSGRGLARVS